jgi:ABC-type nitrate/sulfonate/bicarbonate transport system permease component
VSAALLEDAVVASRGSLERPRRPGTRWRRLLGFAVPLLLLAVWQLVAAAEVLSPRLLPAPAVVGEQLWAFFFGDTGTVTLAGVVPFTGAGTEHLLASLRRAGIGWLLAVGVGTVVGLLMGLSALARDLFDPVLNALRAVPIFAWLPLALVWFGIGEGAARALIFVGALWPVLVAVGDATSRVPRAYVETARMLGTPRKWLWRKVYLPSALPEVVTGLRLSLTLAWTVVIVGELSGTTSGVGAMMNAARESGRTDQVIVGILVFAAVGLLADVLLRLGTRRWVRWASA